VRRIHGYVLAGVLVLLAGCGGGGGSGSSSGGGNPPPVDTTPDGFTFPVQSGLAPSEECTSDEITITGLTGTASITVTGGEYSINGGAFTSAAGTVSNTQRVRVRVTASGQFSTQSSATLTVGGISGTFTVTTVAADTTPAAFQFPYAMNAPRNGWISSAAVTISGINTATPVSVENGEYSIAGGAFTSAPGTITAGQSIVVRVRASSDFSRITIARLTVGTLTRAFEATSELPNYIPESVAFDGEDTVYLLSGVNRLVFRWSIEEARYIDAWSVGTGAEGPTVMAYSPSHQRLYFGYASGAIRQLAVTANNPAETAFATATAAIGGIGSAGNFITVQVSSWYNGGTVYNGSGAVVDQGGYYYGYSRETAWDPTNNRLYYTRDGISPNDIHYDVINQTTGEVTSTGESPYHGDYAIQGPIRVSTNGQYVLLGSGNIYSHTNLNWAGSVGGQVADARWFANGSLATLSTVSNQTTLRRLSSDNLTVLEQRTYAGQALRIVGSDAAMAVVTSNGTTVQIHGYVPDDDSDDDGVENTVDAFPLDRAASADADRDGFPGAWNAGMGVGDSTTGLTLDAFPQDAACWLASHGSGGVCNYGATVPNYTPDQIAHHGDVIYLLSSSNRRVYRWSISGNAYLNPYVVGAPQGFTTTAPTTMAYSAAHQRLYLGYASGAIRTIDVTASSPAEVPFANAAHAINSLNSAGNFLAVQSAGGYQSGFVYNASGAVTDQGGYYYGYSREAAWDPIHSRLYYTRDGISPNDLHYDVINQTTGEITSSGETPYHGDYGFSGVIRVSVNGQYILVGGGDIFSQADMTWSGSVGAVLADARWLANGSLVTATTNSNQTTLRRLGATNLGVLEQLTFPGTALRIVGSDSSMVVVYGSGGAVHFRSYVPDDDSDDDGVENTVDAFPLDRAASVDSDRDGFPNAWNPGRSQADSTTGLALDAFPQDAACWLAAHGSGGMCNYGATVPNYTPDQVAQHGDVVYLLSSANSRVYRWSISGARYLNPLVVGLNSGFTTIAPTTMAHSPGHQRLYLGYSTGAIRYIDTSANSTTEVSFTTAARGVTGLMAVGNFLAAHVGGGYDGGYIYAANGSIADQGGYYYGYSREMAWDPVNSRLYYTHEGLSPNDLQYDVINQASGQITSTAETPYHGSYDIVPPIRVSVDGQYVLLGSGDLYNQNGLTWAGSLGGQVADARWMANGSLVTLATSGNQTVLRRLGAGSLNTVEQITFTGQAHRVVGSDTSMVVLVIHNGTVQFHAYAPDDDSDDDGVENTQDAFPLDVAASADSDRDGYPDAWNTGRSQADSTTGLVLDAFPSDAACWLASHGSGGVCNYGATIPNYVPDQVLSNGDVIYLLSRNNRRVYRWSMATGAYLNPYVVGITQGFATVAPTRMAFSAAHNRLYLGYENGAIRYLDVGAAAPLETPFANVSAAVGGLASVGNFVLAQDSAGAWETHYIINQAGVITDQEEWNHYSPEYAWDPVTSRVYFFSMWSPADINYEVIDQATGEITGEGEAPYHGDYSIQAPIRVSPDGQRILLGSGDVYAQSGLTWSGSLGKQITDAFWTSNILVDLDTTDRVEIRDPDTRAVIQFYQYPGTPLRVVAGQSEVYLVHVLNNTTSFLRLPFYDQDADTIPRWWEQRYGLSDTSAADAALDPDSDGLDNADEYAAHSDPQSADTDADGLGDAAEANTHGTRADRADTDGDGLNDGAEVNTHLSDPLDTDSDDDGYSDQLEVLYGGDPNDPTGLPQPLTQYTQTFEGSPDLSAWTMPSGSEPWAIDTQMAHGGTASLKSGTANNVQFSNVRFRAFFATGTLTYWARLDASYCCNRMYVIVDGQTSAQYIATTGSWNQYSIPLTLGVHDIEWRFERDYATTATDAARIDDVVFTGQ
jgi:hypothetical protein